MAVTNMEIIAAECLLNGIIEEVHTYAKWKSLGFQVKRGEKALIQTMLWKKVTKKKGVEDTEDTVEKIDGAEEKTAEDGAEKKKSRSRNFYKVKSSLFGRSQVEPIKK